MAEKITDFRASRDVALSFAKRLTPAYAEMLQALRLDGGRMKLPAELAAYLNKIGSYVLLYQDENRINVSMSLGIFGEEEFRKMSKELNASTPEEQQAFVDDVAGDSDFEDLLEQFQLPQTKAEWEAARKAYAALPEAEQALLARRGVFFYGALFAGLFNTLSLMVHGAKLTTLVPRARLGDDDAFLKAVQIDRQLLIHHPYFRDRKQQAQDNEDQKAFREKLAYREINPPFRGRIRYPALYMLFGILDTLRWLDDLPHKEILELCDQAGLERYDNRIDDVTNLRKRLLEYRRWQKTGGLSMH